MARAEAPSIERTGQTGREVTGQRSAVQLDAYEISSRSLPCFEMILHLCCSATTTPLSHCTGTPP